MPILINDFKIICTIFLGIILAVGATNVHAEEVTQTQNSQPEEEMIDLDTIVVSATRTERDLFDVAASVALVTETEMEREPKATIAEYLQDIPGVEVTDGGMAGGVKRIEIRGESGARVLILIDGMKISDQKSSDGSVIMIDPSNVERIEVIKGPGSVLYGSEAIGGVVNIITKKGGDKPIEGSMVAMVNSATGSLTPVASVYGLYNGVGYRFSGDYTDADNREGASGTIEGTEYRQHNQSAYIDYTTEIVKIGVGYDRFSARVPIYTGTPVTLLDLPLWSRERLYGFVDVEPEYDYLKKFKAVVFAQETEKDFVNVVTRGGGLTDTFATNLQNSLGVNVQTDWTFGDSHYVIVGMDYLKDHLEANEDRYVFTPASGRPYTSAYRPASVTEGIYIDEAEQETLAFFVQDEWMVTDDITATFGLRQTWIESSLTSTNSPLLRLGTISDSNLVGSVGLVYAGFENWRLRANYGQGYRFPLLNQLYIGTVHGSRDPTLPNPDLKPETSQNFELGVRYDNDALSFDLAVFYSMAENYIYSPAAPDDPGFLMFNNGNTADTYGAELILSYTFDQWGLTPYFSGAYLHREIDRGALNGDVTDQTGDPRWSGRTGVRFEHDFSDTFSIHTDAYIRMVAGSESASWQKATAASNRPGSVATPARDNVTDYHGWATTNFAIGAQFGDEKKFNVDVNFNNIFNKEYLQGGDGPEQPGSHFVLRVGVEF